MITYLPLRWQFELHKPAESWWPVCGAKAYDGSASVAASSIPRQLQNEPELAARIARLALDWATR